jgi:excinuclease ABC subunit A
MHGCDDEEFDVEWNYERGKVEGTHKMRIKWPGFCGHVDEEYQRKHADKRGEQMLPLMSEKICPICHSWRLEPERLEYKIVGKHIGELTDMDAAMAFDWFSNQNFPNGTETLIKEILSRLDSLIQAGISYAALSRISSTLSGGEFQRLRLAGVLKSPLSGVLYVMDEPGFGLSMKDSLGIQKLIKALHEKGNTIILSDHNPDILEMADEIIELGPGGGENGGQLIGQGNGKDFLQKMRGIINGIQPLISPNLTGISIQSANIHNVKNLDISFPANTLSVLSGDSGSGKTSILQYVIHESFERKRASNCADIQGIDLFDEHIFIEQDIYAGSTVSVPLTYLDLFDEIRKFFAAEAKSQNIALKASHFSFFTRDGQCPQCQGSGIHKVSLDFISDAVSACEMCGGDRYNVEVLKFSVDGFNISQLMNLSLKELGVFLEKHFAKKIFAKLKKTFQILNLIGLGYLSGNQNLNTLSSGEMQRLKLIKRLSELKSSNALILLDEPGSGLHSSDMQKMLGFFDYLLEEGHTIIAASHNPMIIKRAGFGVKL